MYNTQFMKPINFLVLRQVISPQTAQKIIATVNSDDPEDLIALLCDESIEIPESKMDIFCYVIDIIRELPNKKEVPK